MNVLFVCQGNTCRSPIAEGILRKLFSEANLSGLISSAGFEQNNVGKHPDPRAIAATVLRGIDISEKKAKLFTSSDFSNYDKIFAMDSIIFQKIAAKARGEDDLHKVDFLLNLIEPGKNMDIPDPYDGNFSHYEMVFHSINKACRILMQQIDHE
jgi:protein-tyrosine phosphatase